MLKEKALEQFKAEHYHEAISTLKEALKESPDDAEIYYYIGFFSHYIGSDSRLYAGYDSNYVEMILEYLDKAIDLNPNYGDAKYFYGAECTTNAFKGMQNRDVESIKSFMNKAYEKGAFPKWLIEFGKNILNSCEQDAILFTAGDADLNVCLYLQIIEKVRTDITILPIGNIDRPWFIQYIKDGLEGVTRKINIRLQDNQIMQIRPFKWKKTPISIQINNADRAKYNLGAGANMTWDVLPDYYSDRMHSKIEGEDAQKRTYLSPQRGMLLQIVEDNMALRPIYFTNFSIPVFYGGLQDYFQNCGLVSKLIPIKVKDTIFAIDYDAVERLMKEENMQDIHTVKTSSIPRIERIIFNYYYLISLLADRYKNNNDTSKLKKLEHLFNSKLKLGFEPEKTTEKLFE